MEKRAGSYHCVNCDTKLFESRQNTRVDLDGHHFTILCQMYLKLKPIIILVMLEQNIIVRNVGHHGHIFNDGPKPTQIKDFVTMVNV